jgi:hypothetical protein
VDSLVIDKLNRSNQLIVTRCVVRELAELCAQRSYEHDRMSHKADEIATGEGGDVAIGRPDLMPLLRALWQRAKLSTVLKDRYGKSERGQ